MHEDGSTVEEWRPVVGWEGLYEVSDLGRVRTVERRVNYAERSHRVPARVRALSHSHDGYVVMDLWRDSRPTRVKVHHLVLEAFVGPCPDRMECRHLNNIRDDNRPSNLAWGTVVENTEDRMVGGTQPIGEAHGCAVLTEADVLEIRALRGVMAGTAVARKYGMGHSTIYAIWSRRLWKHL